MNVNVGRLLKREVKKYLSLSVARKKLIRLVLSAKLALDDGYAAVVVNSEDTDVFILLVLDAKLYQRCGTQTRTKLVDIGKVA